MIPNNVLRDKGLSLKARGLLAEMLSHRPGWVVHRDSLESERDGRSAIQSAINELKDAGVLEVERVKDENGRLTSGVDYRLSHARWEDSPKAENPTQENPTQENRPYKKTNSKEEQVVKNIPARKKNPPTKLPDDWEPTDKHRAKALKLGISDKLFAETVTAMRRWAIARDVTRSNWNMTFSSFLGNTKPDTSPVADRGVEVERLVGEGRVSELSKLLGVKVPVPDFGDVGPQETIRLRKEWLAGWWAVEGKKLL